MKNTFRNIGSRLSLVVAAALVSAAVLSTGCSSTNTQQIISSTSGDGFYAKAAVPVTSGTSIGLQMFVGRFNNSTVLQPTVTNANGIHAPTLAVTVAGAGKQSVSGSAGGTNNAAAISDGSRDASIITTGTANVLGGQSGSNVLVHVTGDSAP